MKRSMYAAGLLALVACALQAQTVVHTAEIPFDFRVSTSTMPAGTYEFRQAGYVLWVKGQGGTHKAAAQITLPASRAKVSSESKIEFHRYGSTYFLAAVWTGNSREGQALPESKQEKELIEHRQLLQTASISLK